VLFRSLWINLITAVTLGLALAFEPTEQNTMRRPPRGRHEPLLSGTLVWHIVLVSLLFLCGVYGMFSYAIERGYSVELARTIAVNTDRKSTRLNSSHVKISYAVFCLKKNT